MYMYMYMYQQCLVHVTIETDFSQLDISAEHRLHSVIVSPHPLFHPCTK